MQPVCTIYPMTSGTSWIPLRYAKVASASKINKSPQGLNSATAQPSLISSNLGGVGGLYRSMNGAFCFLLSDGVHLDLLASPGSENRWKAYISSPKMGYASQM